MYSVCLPFGVCFYPSYNIMSAVFIHCGSQWESNLTLAVLDKESNP